MRYLLGAIALLVVGCSGKGEYTRRVESKLELMERHLKEGKQAKAKEVQEDIMNIIMEAAKEIGNIMEDVEDRVLKDVDRKCPKYRQMKSKLANASYAFGLGLGVGIVGRSRVFGVVSLEEIIDMKWGERAQEEWEITKKYLLRSVSMMDEMIEKADQLRKEAKEVRKDCGKK